MVLRHGFKAEANAWARDLRHEMSLAADKPIDIRKLCQHLGLTVMDLSELDAPPEYLAFYMEEPGSRLFSAVTLQVEGERWIVHNDMHELGRQASNIAHEVAHALLRHPVPVLFGSDGERSHDKVHEEEANWLGPALLVSEEAALLIVANDMSIAEAAKLYGTSTAVMQMRINVSGARRRVA